MGHRTDPIRLLPGFSRVLAIWLITIHLLVMGVLWQMQWIVVVKLTLSVLLLGYLIWQVHFHLLRSSAGSMREVLLDSDGNWWLIFNDGTKLQGKLLPESFVKPWLVVLRFKTGAWLSTKSLILPPDSLDRDVARRLRIHLLQVPTG